MHLSLLPTLLLLIFLAPGLRAETLLIRGGTLIDMTGGEPVSDPNILIQDDRISAIWRGGEPGPDYPRDTRVLEAGGKYVMPALIDSHVHYNWYMGELFLAHGVTTVVDLGSRIHWQAAVRRGLNAGGLRGPRYMYCGRIGEEAPADAAAPQEYFASVTRPAEARAAVASIKRHADCIRLGKDMPAENFKAVTAEAERAGLAVIAHSFDALDSAGRGVGGIEHLEGVAVSTIRGREGLAAVKQMTLEEGHKNPLLFQWMEPRYFDEVIKFLVDRGVYLNPTLLHEYKGVVDRTREFEAEDMHLLGDPRLAYIPLDEKLVSLGQYHWADQAKASTDEVAIFVNNSYYIRTADALPQFRRGYQNVQAFLRRFVAAGGKLYSGTDTAAASTPGLSLHHEMQLLADAGVPAADVLASSTRWAAEFLHVDDRLGTLEQGKLADILILDADPLADVANTRRIHQVIKAGKPVDTSYHPDYEFPFHQYGPVSKHLYHRAPVISYVSPASAAQGGQAELRVSGRNLLPGSLVTFNGVPVTTRYVSETELIARLSPRETANPGSYLLGVRTPPPGGGDAEPLEFIVDYRE